MNRETLVASAKKIKAPSPGVVKKYGDLREKLVGEINHLMAARKDLDHLVGSDNRAMMENNHQNHARFMASLFQLYQPEVFVDTVLWVFRAYRSHGFQLSYWPAQLDIWVDILKKHFAAKEFTELYPFYDWMIVNQPAFAELSDQALEKALPPQPGHGKKP